MHEVMFFRLNFLTMKKLFLLFAVTLFITGAYAQESPRFGVKAGLNISGYISDDGLTLYQENTSARAGFNAGFFAILPISERFAIQPELIYSMQGVNLVEPELYVDYTYVESVFVPDYIVPDVDAYGEVDATELLHYINVPVLANIYFTEGISFQIGPQIGFLTQGTARFDSVDESIDNAFPDYDESTDITDRFNTVSLAAAAGLQVELPSDVALGLRYNFGLTDIVDDTEEEVTLLNQVGQFYVGYTF